MIHEGFFLLIIALFYLVDPLCIRYIREDTDYHGNNLNDGTKNKQDTVAACQASCAKNYPQAPYFVWVSKRSSKIKYWGGCWCKNTKGTVRNGIGERGIISGRVSCHWHPKYLIRA